MPRFEPFPGVLYNADVDLDAVVAPPYDVINANERAELAARSPTNVVHVDCPLPDCYDLAGAMLRQWLAEGVLLADPDPALYVYRMGFHDEHGRPHQTVGVIGALEVQEPGEGDVLPHEQTTPKARSDRLQLLRASRFNLSPIWGLSMAPDLSGLLEQPAQRLGAVTDADGVHHRLYRVSQRGVLDAIADAVSSAPVVVADGHHRYHTCVQYRDERREHDGADGPAELTMALVVELSPQQLHVQAIHRLVTLTSPGDALLDALAEWFELYETDPADTTITDRMADARALAVSVGPSASPTWLARPRPGAFDDLPDLDSARLDRALERVAHELRFQHGVQPVLNALSSGEADAAVFLRPVAVTTIAEMARARQLMPPKSTFFAPKPRTGFVFRSLD